MPKALVVIHFYYAEQVDTILNLLKNISVEYDLYCSISNKDKYEYIKQKVLNYKPNAHIVNVANVGYDVWPFCYVINNVNLADYDYIIKLHTKRDTPGDLPTPLGNGYFVGPGCRWRENLYAFIASKENFNKCINALKKPEIGMCARFNLIHGMANHCGVISEAKKKYPKYILNLRDYSFVAGTMFIAKAAPFQILKDMQISEQLFAKPTEKHDMQFAHVIERTIGEIIYKSGMKIVDPFTPKKYVKEVRKQEKKLVFLKRAINYLVFLIPVPYIRRKSRIFLMDKFFIPHVHIVIDTDKRF